MVGIFITVMDRSREGFHPRGSLRQRIPEFSYDFTQYSDQRLSFREEIVDGGGDGALVIEKFRAIPCHLTGFNRSGSLTEEYKDFVVSELDGGMPPLLSSPLGLGAASTKMHAKSNPFVPKVDYPVFLAELRNIPSILKRLRDEGPKRVAQLFAGQVRKSTHAEIFAKSNLTWQFGLKPFIDDMVALVKMTSTVEARFKQFEKLQSAEGLRVRRQLFEDTQTDTRLNYVVCSQGGLYVEGNLTTTRSVKQWGVMTYHAIPGFERFYELEDVRRYTLGLHFSISSSAAQLWELMPWSWLIDYYANFSEFFAATRELGMARRGPMWICTHSVNERTFQATRVSRSSDTTCSFVTPYARRETKLRELGIAPTIAVNLPFISLGQASILSSLSITKSPTIRRMIR